MNLGSMLKSVAPTLATMLGGPLAGTAVTALESAFGTTPSPDASVSDRIDSITKAITAGQMTPDVIAKIRAADQHHAEIMGQQQIDLAKLNADQTAAEATTAAGDRDSARKRQEAMKDQTPAHLAYIIIFGFFAVSGALLWGISHGGLQNIDGQGWLLIGSITGYLASEAKAAAAYFFGSTSGSSQKNDIIAKAVKSGE